MSLNRISNEIWNILKTDFLVETGTLNGDGVFHALERGFKNIISIDVEYSTSAHARFVNNTNVSLIQGNSSTCLWHEIKHINSKITFWLDAHADLIPHKNWNPVCPIIEELDQIKMHPIKNHNILIDDVLPIIKIPNLSKQIIENKIQEINTKYNIIYINVDGTQVLIASLALVPALNIHKEYFSARERRARRNRIT